ncbi:hypothetical protein [Maribacter sp. 2307UL18-2]|uniref:hypothetical protein n=1 Tax=Maribacter sp. 2307UL18-2 TaxID=3386274 RepID=UPI0039BCD0CF
MKSFLNIVTFDYLQRTRSYGFLITLCISLAIAYSFVPEPNANYSTIRIGKYLGAYNAAWFGYVTAIMTSIFLSLMGFYLVNSGIEADTKTRVGQIMAGTPVKNRTYLFAKTLSNFLVLLTITALVFLMGIALFLLYHDTGFSLEIGHFIRPYLFVTLPALFFISALAVCFEVLIGRFTILQNVVFFFVFCTLAMFSPPGDSHFTLDVFGSKIVTHQMEEQVHQLTGISKKNDLTIGYILGDVEASKKFEFNGIHFPYPFLLSRIAWVVFGLLMVLGCATVFHRFDFRRPFELKKRKKSVVAQTIPKDILLSNLTPPKIDYSLFPLVKTEFLLLLRKGKKWLWLFNLIGMGLLAFLPFEMAHKIVLPILWFLQVGRLSDLTSKEHLHRVHYLTFSSDRPIRRLLLSQLLAASALMFTLALPLIFRYGMEGNHIATTSIVLGSIGIVLFAALLGQLSKGKKLFEVLFFLVSYANINGIPFMDYFGALHTALPYVLELVALVVLLAVLTLGFRKIQLKQ